MSALLESDLSKTTEGWSANLLEVAHALGDGPCQLFLFLFLFWFLIMFFSAFRMSRGCAIVKVDFRLMWARRVAELA